MQIVNCINITDPFKYFKIENHENWNLETFYKDNELVIFSLHWNIICRYEKKIDKK